MKLSKLITLTFSTILLLTGCTSAESTILTGEVTAISTNNFKVEGDLNGSEYDGYVDVDSLTSLYNSEGERIRLTQLEVGDQVEVSTGGLVMNADSEIPTRVTAVKINLLEDREAKEQILVEDYQAE